MSPIMQHAKIILQGRNHLRMGAQMLIEYIHAHTICYRIPKTAIPTKVNKCTSFKALASNGEE